MKRNQIAPRADWKQKVLTLGLTFALDGGENNWYWNESAYFEFDEAQAAELEKATNELYSLCLKAVEKIVNSERYLKLLQIPEHFWHMIQKSWELQQFSIYGRFDLSYDGKHPPKLLEFNADTPTTLLEASVVQWFWLQETFPHQDQLNCLHEKVIENWKQLPNIENTTIYFGCVKNCDEDLRTIEYLRETAVQAGFKATNIIFMEDIGYNEEKQCFVDLDEEPIEMLFKLYPWEWLVNEKFAMHIACPCNECKVKSQQSVTTQFIEPIWKMVLSNKAVLPILWELFPGHPNLLESHFTADPFIERGGNYVKKPILSREGSNISIFKENNKTMETSGSYGDVTAVYQEVCMLPCFADRFPMVGAWIVGREAAGVGIREDVTPITTNYSRFVPHIVDQTTTLAPNTSTSS